jgi:hypothetical protein
MSRAGGAMSQSASILRISLRGLSHSRDLPMLLCSLNIYHAALSEYHSLGLGQKIISGFNYIK